MIFGFEPESSQEPIERKAHYGGCGLTRCEISLINGNDAKILLIGMLRAVFVILLQPDHVTH